MGLGVISATASFVQGRLGGLGEVVLKHGIAGCQRQHLMGVCQEHPEFLAAGRSIRSRGRAGLRCVAVPDEVARHCLCIIVPHARTAAALGSCQAACRFTHRMHARVWPSQ